MQLREYQKKALDSVSAHWRSGKKKVLLQLPTGAGKTEVFIEAMRRCSVSGKRCIMVVRGRELVNQAHKRLEKAGVYHGVAMSNHWNFKPLSLIQICSIDTLVARDEFPPASLVVIDEAHSAQSDSYLYLSLKYPQAFFLCVTATPFQEKDISHVATEIVKPTTFLELVELGFLIRPRYFAPKLIDFSDIKITAGDFNKEELDIKIKHSSIVGDVVETYKTHANNRPAIVFCSSVRSSVEMSDRFNSNGIPAQHLDADSSDELRESTFQKLKNNEIKVVTNCNIVAVGVDLPFVSAIFLARPTLSKILHIQQIGRGTRVFQDKKDFLVFDHVGNIKRHGFIESDEAGWITPPDIKKKCKKDKVGSQNIKTCQKCYFIYDANKTACPDCRFENPKKQRSGPDSVDGDLKEINPSDQAFDSEVRAFISKCKQIKKEKNYRSGWVYHQVLKQYGAAVASSYVTKRKIPEWVRNAYISGKRNSTQS